MMEAQAFWLFLSGALLLNITPGPDMAFTLASTAHGGARAGVVAAIGVGVGSLGWAVATALGLAAMLAASENALSVIRILGGAYLVFLCWRTLTDRDSDSVDPALQRDQDRAMIKAFRAGVVTNLFNPKVGLFYLAFLPTFVDPNGAVALQMLLLGTIFSVTGALVLVLVALGVGSAQSRVMASQHWRKRLKILSASVFGGLGLYLIYTGTHR